MIYFDTSIIVSALTNEARADQSRKLIAETAAKATSGWVMAEIASALALKTRVGYLSQEEAAKLFSNYIQYVVPDFDIYDVTPIDFSEAANLIMNYTTSLRSGDALHLAVVVRCGGVLATFDNRLAAAARAVGVEVIPP